MIANLATLEALQNSHGHRSPASELAVFNSVPRVVFERPDVFDMASAVEIVENFTKAVRNNDDVAVAEWQPQYEELKVALLKATVGPKPTSDKWDQIYTEIMKLSRPSTWEPTPRERIKNSRSDDDTTEPRQPTYQVAHAKNYSTRLEGTPDELAEFLNLYGDRLGIASSLMGAGRKLAPEKLCADN